MRYIIPTFAIFLFSISTVLAQATPIKAVASFSILADIVKNIGGRHVEVLSIVGPNADAHVYQPTPDDSKKLAHADIVFINGLGFEGWIDRLIEASGFKERGSVIIVSKDVKPLKAKEVAGKGKLSATDDPHAWHSVPAVMKYVKEISSALQKLDPLNAAVYQKNATEYLQRLRLLDEWVRDEIARVPQAKRLIITAHDAFQYFAKEYGVEFLSPMGVSTDAEPSPEVIKNLIDKIKQDDIKVIFVENMTNEKPINMIKESTKIEIGGVLYSDALAAPEDPEDIDDLEPAVDYTSLMRHNVSNMVAAMLAK